MLATLTDHQITRYVVGQMNSFFPDEKGVSFDDLYPAVPRSIQRLEHCFSRIKNKYYFNGQDVLFSHLNGDQYATWLYFLSNELFINRGARDICEKIYLLNKALHGCDIFFEVQLPSVFMLVHPVGTVLGRATYRDFFVVYQRCGIGSNKGAYPDLGEKLIMRPGSSILGACKIDANCQLASGAMLVDTNVEENTLVFGNPAAQKFALNSTANDFWSIG